MAYKYLVTTLLILGFTGLTIYSLIDKDGCFEKDPGTQPPSYANHLTGLKRPIRIMLAGDSITHASPDTGNFRCRLWHKLQTLGSFDFVGSMNGMVYGGKEKNCDNDHEAHSGWKADQVLRVIKQSSAKFDPDIVIIHLGTNDLIAGNSVGSTAYEISQIIYELREDNPLLVVFVAGVIPNYQGNNHTPTMELNRRISNMTGSISTKKSPVIFVDHFTGFDESDMADRLHPNESGAEKIARTWMEAIKNYLQRDGS